MDKEKLTSDVNSDNSISNNQFDANKPIAQEQLVLRTENLVKNMVSGLL